jgi:hypothetical protein
LSLWAAGPQRQIIHHLISYVFPNSL